MHPVTKITFGLGAASLLVGIVLLVIAGGSAADSAGFEIKDSNGDTLSVMDEDGFGDIGFIFYVEGQYLDEDKDGQWDHCSDIDISVLKKPETNPDWDERLDGEFYFQSSEEGPKNCDVAYPKDNTRPGYVKVGGACLACYSGEFEFLSSHPVSVVNADEAIGNFISALLSGLGGSSCLCCGIILLIIGLILALTLKDEPPPPVIEFDHEGKIAETESESNTLLTSDGPEETSKDDSYDQVQKWYEQTENQEKNSL